MLGFVLKQGRSSLRAVGSCIVGWQQLIVILLWFINQAELWKSSNEVNIVLLTQAAQW